MVKPRLTHFISIPIGHDGILRESINAFTSALLSSSPSIPGLDQSIIVPARRLHFTLGVMSLVDSSDHDTHKSQAGGSRTGGRGGHSGQARTEPGYPSTTSSSKQSVTVNEAVELLQALAPKVRELLGYKPFRIPLDQMDIMTPDRGDPHKAHVLWVGPVLDSPEGMQFKKACDLIRNAFNDGGMMVDTRPLKLHCTLINTVYRKPRSRNGRSPFSFPAVLSSTCFRDISASITDTEVTATTPGISTGSKVRHDQTKSPQTSPPRRRGPHRISLGPGIADHIQICEMGSHGPEGEYVSVGGFSLSSGNR